MRLTEQHVINKNHKLYQNCDKLTRLAKLLYNATLYDVRQHYFATNKYKPWEQVKKDFTKTKNVDYYALPTKAGSQVIRQVGSDFSSFFNLLVLKKKGGHGKSVKIPGYKKSVHAAITIPKESISKKVVTKDDGLFEYTVFSKNKDFKFTFTSRHDNVDALRVVPKNGYFVLEEVRTVKEIEPVKDNGKYASIDIGLNNLMAVFFNFNEQPVLYNGRHLKSINQHYNKKKAKVQANLAKCNNKQWSKYLEQLTNKCNRKIDNELHVVSNLFVNHVVSLGVSKVYIGKSPNWKQDINIGKRNNQNFVSIPHARLIDLLTYKLKLKGIVVVVTEESYTSKCSALDKEEVCKHEKYAGRRIKRGLFKTSTGFKINADINGAINIMRKAVSDEKIFFDEIEAAVVRPAKVLPSR